jgi:hypothetical protein
VSVSENRKVGIITYHRAINFGAALQAFALQWMIKEFGVKCEILDYRNIRLENIHKKMSIFECKNLKDLLRYIMLSQNNNKKHDKFRAFTVENIEMSSPLFNFEDLIDIENNYDRIITGSDQVWNYEINGMDYAFFLDFVKDASKKKAYAASFGLSKIPEEYRQVYKELLIDFDPILIREKQGADIIRDLLSKEAPVVLDPTMLLSKDKWLNLDKNMNSSNDKYILVYAFGGSINIKDLAINISHKTGYKIFWIGNSYKCSTKIKYIKSAGPEEFISLFNNAEYIITNSFHGTAFSINFNKQFFTELLPESTGVNSRLEDILDLFDLQGRKIISSDADVINSNINYYKVNKKLEEEREKSMSLLKDVIFN